MLYVLACLICPGSSTASPNCGSCCVGPWCYGLGALHGTDVVARPICWQNVCKTSPIGGSSLRLGQGQTNAETNTETNAEINTEINTEINA